MIPAHLANMNTREITLTGSTDESKSPVSAGSPSSPLSPRSSLIQIQSNKYELDDRFPKVPRLLAHKPTEPMEPMEPMEPVKYKEPRREVIKKTQPKLHVKKIIAAFRESLEPREEKKHVSVQPVTMPVNPVSVSDFTHDSTLLLQEYTKLATNIFQMFLACAEETMGLYLKLIYFTAQVAAFTPVLQDTLDQSVQELYQRFRHGMASCLQKNMGVIEAFTTKFDIDAFVRFIKKQVEVEKGKIVPSNINTLSPKAQVYLDTKDHIQSQRIKVWQTFFQTYNKEVQSYFNNVTAAFTKLTEIYSKTMFKVVEITPEIPQQVQALFRNAFAADQMLVNKVDLNLLDKVIKAPRGILSRSLVNKNGPLLVCSYLKSRKICEKIEIPTDLLPGLTEIFDEFSSLYSEFHNQVFQIGIDYNFKFSNVIGQLVSSLQQQTTELNRNQKKINNGLSSKLTTSPNFMTYVQALDNFYLADTVKTVVTAQQEQIKVIETMLGQDFIFLHS